MAASMNGTKLTSDMAVDYRTLFDDIFSFLFEFDWIHNFQVTKFFVNEVWTHIPAEWHDFLLSLSSEELNRLPYEDREGKGTDTVNVFFKTLNTITCPDSLRRFLQMSHKLSLQRTPARESHSHSVDTSLSRGMTPKKLHEVDKMSVVVAENASKAGCDVIVDIGSGLGYLGQMLHKTYGYPVIGVEGCAGHTERAEKRSVKQDLQENCIQNVTFNLNDSQEHLSVFEDVISAAIRDIEHCQHSHTRSQSCDQGQSCDRGQSCDQAQSCDRVPSCDHVQSFNRLQSCPKSYLSDLCERDTVSKCQHGLNSSLDSAESFRESFGTECVCMSDDKGWDKIVSDGQNCFTETPVRTKVVQDSSCYCGLTQLDSDKFVGKCKTEKNSLKCAIELGHSAIEGLETSNCVCMIGLHCCGDLTPTMLHYFLEMSKVKSLCLVSCCYHKMGHDAGGNKFHRFPLSHHCQESYREMQKEHPHWRLQPVSMRLAAQETRSRWRNQTEADHSAHTRHVAYRGLLEILFQEARLDVEKVDRKIIRKADFSSFNSFTTSIIQGLDVRDDVRDRYRQQLQDIHDRYSPYVGYIEIITALQVIIQPVLESLIQQDRHAYLIQHGVQAEIVPIFDENISPRNMALIAHKE